MQPTLHVSTENDLYKIVSWIPDAATCLHWAGPAIPFPIPGEHLSTLLETDLRASYCLKAGVGMLMGFGQFSARGNESVHLSRIIVAPAERGNDVGGLLCATLIAKALKETNAAYCTLRVYPDNHAALAIYRKLGFYAVESASDRDVQFMRTCDPHG